MVAVWPVLAAYGLPNTLDLMPYYMLATLTGVLVLGPARRFWAFFRAGIAVALAGIAMILAFRLPFNQMDWVGIVTLVGAALFNGFPRRGRYPSRGIIKWDRCARACEFQ